MESIYSKESGRTLPLSNRFGPTEMNERLQMTKELAEVRRNEKLSLI